MLKPNFSYLYSSSPFLSILYGQFAVVHLQSDSPFRFIQVKLCQFSNQNRLKKQEQMGIVSTSGDNGFNFKLHVFKGCITH